MRCRRLAYVWALVMLLTLSPAYAAAKPGTSWAQAELETVVAAGIMAKAAAARPDSPLTQGELEGIVAGLTHTEAPVPPSPAAKVTMAALDARLVAVLGLTDSAKLFTQSARTAGIAPPSRFGTEAVARLLGLRTNHPAALDSLELSPGQPATHAEAAYSAARMLKLGERDAQSVQELAASFVLPALTPWQTKVQKTAVRFIGYPYVWGGESEFPESPFGPQVHGGFDCSGFVWRVYKVEQYADGGSLPDMLQGRTTYAMSGEVPVAKRIPLRQAPARRRHLLRSEGTKVEGRAGRPHGRVPRQRLVHPLFGVRSRGYDTVRLVPKTLRLGPTAARRSGPRVPRVEAVFA